MTSHDLRDVLDLSTDGARPTKKQKAGALKTSLKGLAREVQNLGGDNPIAIVPEAAVFKKRRFTNRKPVTKWELKCFTNSARRDGGGLVLRHWKPQCDDGHVQETSEGCGETVHVKEELPRASEDSDFAKFNVAVNVPQYSEDQYEGLLASSVWTRAETDYLIQLVKEYDLRWAVIWDRYDFAPPSSGSIKQDPAGNDAGRSMAAAPKPARTMEDLKARYYEIASTMMALQTSPQYMSRSEYEVYDMMQKFNPAQERSRKEFVLNTMSRSKDEAREEESLLLEVKRILARSERFNEERHELYCRLDYPSTETDTSIFKSSQGLHNLLQNLMNADKTKKRKSLMGPDGASAAALPAAGKSAIEGGLNRRESVAALVNSHRDSIVGTPVTPYDTATIGSTKKKGAMALERRRLTAYEEELYGVSHHERLSSGPTFRYEKINKLFSHKSGQQQMRMTNALAELDVPPRLFMPTAAVTTQFEALWAAVNSLIDVRKMADKLDGELKIEEMKRVERDKMRAASSMTSAARGGDGTALTSTASSGPPHVRPESVRDMGRSMAHENPRAAPQTNSSTNGYPRSGSSEVPRTLPPLTSRARAASRPEEESYAARASASAASGDAHTEVEKTGGKEKTAARKRSASALSSTSNMSPKRPKA